jgi:transcriptional regulator with XRE-family HTH domain
MDEEHPKLLLKAFGRRIRELRAERGYSQEGFADKCGVHRTFMGTIERGESNLSFQNILKVATTLGVSLSSLFSQIEERAGTLTASTRTPRGRNRVREPSASEETSLAPRNELHGSRKGHDEIRVFRSTRREPKQK